MTARRLEEPQTRVVLTHAEIWVAAEIDEVIEKLDAKSGRKRWARFTTVEGVPVAINRRRVLYVQHEGR